MLGKTVPKNGRGLDSNKPSDFQPIAHSVPLSFFNSNVLNVGR